MLRCWLRSEYENLYAAPPADLSLIHRWEPFRLPGDDVMITDAAEGLIRELAGDLTITYDSLATAIVRRGDTWGVHTADSELVADALSRIGAGLVTKAFFAFDRAFWAPRRTFWIAGDPPAPFELWVDVSAVRGAPTLCAFAAGNDARAAERMTEDELLAAGWATLRSATGLVDPPPR